MKLKDLSINIFSGGTPSTVNEEYWNGDFYWLSSGETKNPYIRKTEKTITQLGIDKSSTRLAKVGDVVIASAGQGKTRGQVAYCLVDTYINQSIIAIRTNPILLDSKYLFYNLTSRYNELRLLSDSSSSRGSLTVKIFEDLNVSIPKLEKQKKIAKFLSNYDDLIENNNRRIKILEEIAQKIYKEWFVDFKFPGHETTTFKDSPLGKIPNDWEVDFVKNILIRLKSKHKYTQNNILKEGKIIVIDQSTSEYLGFHNDKPDFKANPQKPLIIFGDHTCKMQMLVEDFSIGPNVIPISSEKVPITFLYYLIDSLIETKEYKRHWNDLISKKVVLPINSLSESFSNIITPLMTMINHLKHKNMKLKQTRDILLPRLISGEINVENMEVL